MCFITAEREFPGFKILEQWLLYIIYTFILGEGSISIVVGSPLHTLLVHIKVDVRPIVRGNIQTVRVTIEDGQGKPIDGANVQGEVDYASHESTELRVNAKNQSFRYLFVYFLIIEFEETPLSE